MNEVTRTVNSAYETLERICPALNLTKATYDQLYELAGMAKIGELDEEDFHYLAAFRTAYKAERAKQAMEV